MENMRVQRALKYSIPIAADRAFEIGSEVLVWREKAVDTRIDVFFPGRSKCLELIMSEDWFISRTAS